VSASRPSDEASPRESGTLILDYHPEAAIELIETARFYEESGAGLGHRFLDAVDVSLEMLQRSPLLGCSDECGRRKWLIRGFPYMVIYRLEDSLLHILAIAHTSRNPRYWENREYGGE
jgi:toxin ParE1/3/4